MNALKYLNSRLGKTVEQMKRAYMSDKHICFLVTSEPEFMKDLLDMASILPNHKEIHGDFPKTGSVSFVYSPDFIKDSLRDMGIDKETLYVYQVGDDGKLPVTALKNYINHYSSFSYVNYDLNEGQKRKIRYLKNSLLIIIVNSKPQIPSYIEPYSETVIVPFMSEMEFKEYVSGFIERSEGIATLHFNEYSVVPNSHYLDKLYHNMRGMNATQIKATLQKNQNLLGRIYYSQDEDKYEAKLNTLIKNIRKEFERMIETSRALTLEEPSDNEPAGLNSLTKWLDDYSRQVANPQDFVKYVLEAPKGLLVSGVPGSGKSMMARYVAGRFGLSLVRLDFGNLGGAYVGDSEKNMDNALNMIEALSPCVLWVDEMEKAFSGTNGNSSNDVTKRLFGKFLTWMQEKSNRGVSCFIFATANDISQMPPEMFRSGRFDAKFFTFMPTAEECAGIFESIIAYQVDKHKGQESKNIQAKPLFNMKRINGTLFKNLIEQNDPCLTGNLKNELSDRSVNRRNKFFTGADIDQLIKKAKNIYLNGPVESSHSVADAVFHSARFEDCLIQAIKEIKTYGETNLDDIAKCYTQLAINNFNNASNSCVLPFEGYDELAYISRKDNEDIFIYDLNRFESKGEESHYNSLSSGYDKCLYLIVRNTINKLAKEITKKRLQ